MERKQFLSALSMVKPALSNQDFIPILSHFCFDGESVTAHNDVMALRAPCKTEFKAAFHGDTLLRLLDNIRSDILSFTKDESCFKIKTGRSRLRLPFLEDSDFLFESPDRSKSYKEAHRLFISDDFILGLECCLASVDEDPVHPNRMGITLSIGEKDAYFYSTDSFSVSRYLLKGDYYKDMSGVTVILPTEFCKQLLLFKKSFSGDGYLVIAEDFVMSDFGDNIFVHSKLIIDLEPLDFGKVLDVYKDSLKHCTSVFPPEIEECLQRSKAILTTVLDTGKLSEFVIKNRQININTKSDMGEVADVFTVNKKAHKSMSVSINPDLILRVLKRSMCFYFSENALILSDNNFTHYIAYRG